MTSAQVAEAAGVDVRRVYVAIDKGEVPAYRIGRVYRFKRSEVEAWMRGDPPEPPREYPQEVKAEAVARYITGDLAEDVAVAVGLSPVAAWRVEEWVVEAAHPVRRDG